MPSSINTLTTEPAAFMFSNVDQANVKILNLRKLVGDLETAQKATQQYASSLVHYITQMQTAYGKVVDAHDQAIAAEKERTLILASDHVQQRIDFDAAQVQLKKLQAENTKLRRSLTQRGTRRTNTNKKHAALRKAHNQLKSKWLTATKRQAEMETEHVLELIESDMLENAALEREEGCIRRLQALEQEYEEANKQLRQRDQRIEQLEELSAETYQALEELKADYTELYLAHDDLMVFANASEEILDDTLGQLAPLTIHFAGRDKLEVSDDKLMLENEMLKNELRLTETALHEEVKQAYWDGFKIGRKQQAT